MTSKIVSHAVENLRAVAQAGPMARKARPNPKPSRRATFIKAWRKHRGLTLEKLSERLMVEQQVELSEGQLSRIERGEQPYAQDMLEAIAQVLRCDVGSLLMRDPGQPDPIWSVWDTLGPVEQRQAIEVIKALKRTGTD